MVIALFSASCSEYSKIMKSSDSELKYQKVFEYFDAKDYYKALGLIEDIRAVYKGTDKYETLCFYNAFCNYQQKEYSLAAYLFKEYARMYPNNERCEEAEYLSAHCYYLISPSVTLDQSFTLQSIRELELFIEKRPDSKYAEEAKAQLQDLNFKIETKAYNNAMLYYKIRDYKASLVAMKNFLYDYPNTTYREDVMFTMVKASHILAVKSVESKKLERHKNTVQAYISFVDKFPESKKQKEAEKYYTISHNYIENKNGLQKD
ncbi:MAG: outer membrane protein assembly factor BamD [Bacteroidales bacterium]|nr:outer membrane protein assembly factor BamD [Bacteroidales bacterium]